MNTQFTPETLKQLDETEAAFKERVRHILSIWKQYATLKESAYRSNCFFDGWIYTGSEVEINTVACDAHGDQVKTFPVDVNLFCSGTDEDLHQLFRAERDALLAARAAESAKRGEALRDAEVQRLRDLASKLGFTLIPPTYTQ